MNAVGWDRSADREASLFVFLASFLAHADDGLSFGTDVSVGYGAGALLGSWPEAGLHGYFHGRLDAFTISRTESGPRLGASIWASQTLLPLQFAQEDWESGPERFQFSISQYGVLAILRHDPEAPVGADFGFGFGRIDLDDYWDGSQALPTLTFEAGPRVRTTEQTFIDVLARAHWATARGPSGGLDEWWGVSLQVAFGVHAH